MEALLQEKEASLQKFLNKDQIKSLIVDKMKMWNDEGIIKGLKLHFMLGKCEWNIDECSISATSQFFIFSNVIVDVLGVHGYTFLYKSG